MGATLGTKRLWISILQLYKRLSVGRLGNKGRQRHKSNDKGESVMLRLPNDYIKMPDSSNSNFKYKEFIKSNTATRLGINNEPGEDEWVCIEKLVHHILQPVRNKFGALRISSGFRSPELCIKIRSSINSNHTRGQAADFEPLDSNVTLMEVAEWIASNCEFRELICEYFLEGWIHAAYREGGNSKTIKLKDKNHNYTKLSIGEIKNIYS